MGNVQVGIDLWQMIAGIAVFFTAGIVRVELLAAHKRELERRIVILEKGMFAVREELNTVHDGVVKELSAIKETLAWLKGRFEYEKK